MDNLNFINHLQNLTTNRFTLTTLSLDEFHAFHTHLLTKFTINSNSYHRIQQSNPTQDWYLIGTDGCHLCEHIDTQLQHAKHIHSKIPTIHHLDLIDGDAVLVENLGMLIPILLSPQRLLCYPFGIMDIISLPI